MYDLVPWECCLNKGVRVLVCKLWRAGAGCIKTEGTGA